MKLLLGIIGILVFISFVKSLKSSSHYCKQKCPEFNPPYGTLHLPGPTKSSFYKCNFGVGVLFRCPTGTHFNPEYQICDWPQHAKAVICEGSPNYEPEGSGNDEINFYWQ